ncbi:MAG: hypothetical protein ABIK86_02370, partial [candidate division WOR-3 bacterium]
MKTAPLLILAAALVIVGCTKKSDEAQIRASLENSKFFRALGALPAASEGFTGRGLSQDGDTSLPIWAARVVRNPRVNYTITVERPYADVAFTIDWPCTLFVIYTDIPDTGARDTVVKPAPEIHGAFSAKFELVGNEWQAKALSPCAAEFDSAQGLMRIDSIQVQV